MTSLPVTSTGTVKTELLSPAGDLECGYAALHHGADAVYTGLRRFSARAEAVNLDARELGELAAYAHALTPRRRVFVAVNTLVAETERRDMLDTLLTIAEAGADALIIQDLGVLALARRWAPGLERHASTQLAIHNLDGARRARELGFDQVTLARELTLDEIRAIATGAGVATEAFIHGALCYAYSGLCQYSALTRGRSGNRGQCAYPCRDRFRLANGRELMPFSMKDLALGAGARELARAGVRCLKIEGRKKNALYVAATTRYYRGILDGTLSPGEARECERHIRSIFSRPWTTLNVHGRKTETVTDSRTVGHRGDPIGQVEAVRKDRQGTDWLRFKPDRPLERHDGLQVECPGAERPYGFAVETLRLAADRPHGRSEAVFEAPAGRLVEVALPADHPPLPAGAPVACSSSQAVKRLYRYDRPKPGAFRPRCDLAVTVRAGPGELTAEGVCEAAGQSIRAACRLEATLEPRRATGATSPSRDAVAEAFAKLGDYAYRLPDGALRVENPGELFVPVSLANRLRRELVDQLDVAVGEARAARLREAEASLVETVCAPRAGDPPTPSWIVKTDRTGALASWFEPDAEAPAEFLIEIGREPADLLLSALDRLARRHGGERIRLGLPMVWRSWEQAGLDAIVQRCLARGWRRWECAGLAGTALLRRLNNGHSERLDLTADWPLYAMNRDAIRELDRQGFKRFTLAPEDREDNLALLAQAAGERAVLIAHRDAPLFFSEHCVKPGLVQEPCAAKEKRLCPSSPAMPARSSRDEAVLILSDRCRTIVIGQEPVVLGRDSIRRLSRAGCAWFRMDFLWREWQPADVAAAWRRRVR